MVEGDLGFPSSSRSVSITHFVDHEEICLLTDYLHNSTFITLPRDPLVLKIERIDCPKFSGVLE